MRLAIALPFLFTTACATTPQQRLNMLAATSQDLDSAFSDYADKESADVQLLLANGKLDEAAAKSAKLTATVQRWQVFALTLAEAIIVVKTANGEPNLARVSTAVTASMAFLREIGAIK